MKGSAIPARVFSGPAPVPNNTWLVGEDFETFAGQIKASTIADSGAAAAGWPANWIRPGLILGKITTGGLLTNYVDGNSDGTETALAILLDPIDLNDPLNPGTVLTGTIHARVIIKGRVRSTGLLGYDAAAKVELKARGFIFEDDYEATA